MQTYVRQHQVYPNEFPKSWASGWGEDKFGLWMAFTYKGAHQQFRWCEPGKFLMGSPEEEAERYDDETQQEVVLNNGFWIADTAVTQALWDAVMGYNPSHFKGDSRPVDTVNWDDTQDFILRMNEIKPELKLQLPTEAQWEYACRAGSTTPFCWGEQVNSELVNFDGSNIYNDSRKSEYREETIDVKSLYQNGWGLWQMHGNVEEWCQDWSGEYSAERVVDPKGPESGGDRVLRGGSWFRYGRHCRSAFRFNGVPSYRSNNFGFRLARGL